MSDCLFCKIADKQIPSELVYEDDDYVAFHDINPQAPTHLLVIPKKHLARAAEMTPADRDLVGGLFLVAARLCQQQNLADYRLVINNGEGAGQTVFHLHLHILAGRSLGWPPG